MYITIIKTRAIKSHGFLFYMLFLLCDFYKVSLNSYNKIKFWFISCVLLLPILTLSQNQAGTPFIKNYKPNDFGASTENWAVAQDKRGVMYFGNAKKYHLGLDFKIDLNRTLRRGVLDGIFDQIFKQAE